MTLLTPKSMVMRAVAVGFWIPLTVAAAPPQPAVTSLAAFHQLTNEQAAAHLPVDFDATVTFYRSYEGTLFVQDGDSAVYVRPLQPYLLSAGDRVHVHGLAQESFRPFVAGASVTVLHAGSRPQPAEASFGDLIRARLDCHFIRLRGRVLAADKTMSSDRPSTVVALLVEGGGPAEVQIENKNPDALPPLDADVEVTGVVAGRFDGKMQMTGIVVHAQSMADVRVLSAPPATPWSAAVTPMNEIISDVRSGNVSSRVRVQGTITYSIPGSAVVLQNGSRSLWVNTRTLNVGQIGHLADATGFPDVHDGFLRLANGEILDSGKAAPVQPVPVTWRDLTQSHRVFDLVSIEGTVVAAVREAGQDEYELDSRGHLFTAIFRHPAPSGAAAALPSMKAIRRGSRVRVTGICTLEDSNPFNADVPFDILLRSFDDIALVARPSPLTVANLIRAVGLLAVMVVAVFAWGWMLRRKVTRQTRALASRIEAEAATERYNAKVEQRRSKILEEINGPRPLADILREITELVAFRLGGAPCWCETNDGSIIGDVLAEPNGKRSVREEIPARSGLPLGYLCAALHRGTVQGAEEAQALFQGTRLATLAIETRRLYSDLVRRSEFDLLTDMHNRFSLEKQLDALVAQASQQSFGLIYVDLDEFKGVNDVHGHRVGDLYLQAVSARMKRQLRSGDLLARLGGDEFAAVVPSARTRMDLEEIAKRLEHCFDEPFRIEGFEVRGSASLGLALYPEDGITRESLLAAADGGMYAAKHASRQTQGKLK